MPPRYTSLGVVRAPCVLVFRLVLLYTAICLSNFFGKMTPDADHDWGPTVVHQLKPCEMNQGRDRRPRRRWPAYPDNGSNLPRVRRRHRR
jgi:hypothetical protein